jgi:glutathione S-transferase
MLSSMKLYQIAGCPFAHRARIVLEEKKLPCEVVYYKPGERPAALDAVSPDAKSPTLFDDNGNTPVWDSLVVIEYLEERYPGVALMPPDAGARARARLAMRQVDATLLPAMGPVVQELVHKAAGTADDAKVKEGVARYRAALVPWDARLQGHPFVLGDTFTLADIALFTPIAAMVRLVGQAGDIPEALGALRTWRDRVGARPSTAY